MKYYKIIDGKYWFTHDSLNIPDEMLKDMQFIATHEDSERIQNMLNTLVDSTREGIESIQIDSIGLRNDFIEMMVNSSV